MWKILFFLFFFISIQSLNSLSNEYFNDETVEYLGNVQKELSKLLSQIPDAAWMIHNFKNPGIKKSDGRQTFTDLNNLMISLTAENVTGDISNDMTVFNNYTDKSNTTNKCLRDLVYMAFNFYKMWALQMSDANGKPPSGLLRGNTYWVGEFTECRNVTVPLQIINSNHYGDFNGKYCSVILGLGSELQSIASLYLGICVPDSCNEDILSSNGKSLGKLLRKVPEVKEIGNFTNLQITCQNSKQKWESSHIAYMCVLSIFAAFIVVGTLCDVVVTCKRKRMAKMEEIENQICNPEESVNRNISNNDNEVLINSEVLPDTEVLAVKKQSPESGFVQFLICFSIYTNGAKIFGTENSSSQLQCIHGIRFLSMCWIIMGHSFLGAVAYMENPVDYLNFAKTFSALFIIQATFSVDTFFLLSGLLLSYLFLKNYQGSNKNVNWVYYYLHRFWRLSPALMMVLGFYTTIWLHLGTGPMWPKVTENGHCDKYWWWNLLYIQNFKDNSEMCMAWTWYLANDMQFYIISPIFLILLWKFPVIGFIVVYIVLGISIITTGVLGAKTNIYSIYSWIDSNESGESIALSNPQNFFDDIYDKPYCRIGPYLIGITTGYVLNKIEEYKTFFTTKILILCWIVTLGFSSSVMFGIYHAHMGKLVASVYVAFSRTTWSIAIAWIIFACLAGFGGIINTILSWKAWIPLSRLTYSAYLIHPVVIGGFFSSLKKPYYFQINSMFMTFFGLLMASYMAAAVVSIAFESSMMALEKFILAKISKK